MAKVSTITPKEQPALFAKLQEFPSAVQREDTVTTKDINPATGKNFTGKNKRVLGIPEGNNVIWAWPHFTQHDHATLCGTAKPVDKPVGQFLAEIVMSWFSENRAELETIASEHRKDDKSEEDLRKELAAAERQMARLKAMLEATPSEEPVTSGE